MHPEADAAMAPKGALNWHVLIATWLGELFDGMDASIYVLVLFPALSDLLNTSSHGEVGVVGSYVLAIFMIGWAVGALVFGILSDYIGRARTMVITILLYAICTGLCAFSQTWQELAFYRFLVGCGIGGEISIGAVILSECFKGRSRLHAVAALSTSFGCGYLIAALLNLYLGGFGWRILFLAGVAPALVTLYIRMKIKEPQQFVTVQQMMRTIEKPRSSLLARLREKMVGLTLWKLFEPENRAKVVVVIGLASTAIIGYWAVLSWIPAWVNQLTGTNAVAERSQTAICMNIGAIVAAALGGFMIERMGRRNAMRLTFGFALMTCVGMFLTVKSFGPALLAWVFFVGGFATLPFVFLFAYVPELFHAGIRGTAFGFSVQLGRVFAAMAALAGGQIIALFGGSYAVAGATVASVYLFGMVCTAFMPDTSGEVELGIDLPALVKTGQGSLTTAGRRV